MAAAARMSGTTWPAASVLNRGVIASWSDARLRSRACSRARTEARAVARRVFRAFDVAAEYAGFLRAAGAELRCVAAGFRCAVPAAATVAGTHATTPSSVESALMTNIGRIRRTRPPGTAKRSAGKRPVGRITLEHP